MIGEVMESRGEVVQVPSLVEGVKRGGSENWRVGLSWSLEQIKNFDGWQGSR